MKIDADCGEICTLVGEICVEKIETDPYIPSTPPTNTEPLPFPAPTHTHTQSQTETQTP